MNPHPSSLNLPPLLSYPARPVNGGRLEHAPKKVGPWIVQPKIDDWRAIIHTPTKRIWNRQGEPMSIEKDLAAPLMALTGCPFEWLDVGVIERRCKILRGSIVVFDWIPTPNDILAGPHGFLYAGRRLALLQEFQLLPRATQLMNYGERNTTGQLFLVSDFEGAHHTYQLLQAENAQIRNPQSALSNFYEGIVCKRTDKPYPVQLLSPTKETPWMMKHRFDQ